MVSKNEDPWLYVPTSLDDAVTDTEQIGPNEWRVARMENWEPIGGLYWARVPTDELEGGDHE